MEHSQGIKVKSEGGATARIEVTSENSFLLNYVIDAVEKGIQPSNRNIIEATTEEDGLERTLFSYLP